MAQLPNFSEASVISPDGIIVVLELLSELNEITHEKYPVQCLVYSKCSINVSGEMMLAASDTL